MKVHRAGVEGLKWEGGEMEGGADEEGRVIEDNNKAARALTMYPFHR